MNEDYGGGFSRSQEFGNTRSPAASGGAPGKKRDTTIRAVHIKQLLEAQQQDSVVKIDGKPIAQITLVAVILELEVKSTNIAFIIEDSTGQMEASKFIDPDDSTISEYKEGMYIRIFGHLTTFQGKKSIAILKIAVVKDFNEITFHHLDVIHTHVLFTRSPSQNLGTSSGNIQDNSVVGQGEFNPLETQVMQIFQGDAQNERGVHIDTVVKFFAGRVDPKDVRNAIEQLTAAGFLYSVVDEFHYRCTTQ